MAYSIISWHSLHSLIVKQLSIISIHILFNCLESYHHKFCLVSIVSIVIFLILFWVFFLHQNPSCFQWVQNLLILPKY
jgi:hypothetical protein